MKRFEYRTENIDVAIMAIVERDGLALTMAHDQQWGAAWDTLLNELGGQGWEMIQGPNASWLYFKRELGA